MDQLLKAENVGALISQLDLATLQNICKSENLPHVGNTATLRCRVTKFVNERKLMNPANQRFQFPLPPKILVNKLFKTIRF